MGVLDVKLRDGTCQALAAELTRQEVAFVVYSVSSRLKHTAPEFKNLPWTEKPAPVKKVLATLAELSAGLWPREA